ncbi:hypothetical protein M419DRAFT_74551 [Trichoderma reesei RUT C-30]|jgi:hypothetical protein|uniref:Uncharacterized protein n=1 Tax=Hypocrea jecorina (strain ATCC 56765 / BCRC 32924 / NRRL 11460 / Rut C-30) TaxID=1344414 RepID=A0A024SIB2_HYPJR|nr:hypothetical protein M419DRAFT_74551 [Trichoderma reesei RUT C-30]
MRPEYDDRLPQTTYSFEVEFLVAQELPGFNYDSTFNEYHGRREELPWACPADAKDPYETILNEVRGLLLKYGQPVAICEDSSDQQPYAAAYDPRKARQYLTADDEWWHVEPSVTTYAKRDSPQMYEWFGVRVRSPASQSRTIVDNEIESPTDWILGVLTKGLVMHLNSTCRFNVRVRPLSEDISPVHVKKLVTLVWVLERELLERLCSSSYGRPHPHVRTLSAHSRVASHIWHGSGEKSPPNDPLGSVVTTLHLPQLHNKEVLARLQFLWQMQSLEDLAAALRTTTGEATSFAIQPTGGPFGMPIFEFRYSLWHPFGQLDASKHWIELSVKLLQTSMWNSPIFKKNVTLLDGMIYNFWGSNEPPTYRWKALLAILDLEKWSESWEVIIGQYKDGQRLAARSLDKQKLLHKELKADGQRKTTT